MSLTDNLYRGTEPYEEGRKANQDGVSRQHNPYQNSAVAWWVGWDDAQEDRVRNATYQIKLLGLDMVEVTWSYGHKIFHTYESATSNLNLFKTTTGHDKVIEMLEACIATLKEANEEPPL